MARSYKSPSSLLPAQNLGLNSRGKRDRTVRDRCEAACAEHIKDTKLRQRALGALERARGRRLNARNVAVGWEMRRRLEAGVRVLERLVSPACADGARRVKALERLQSWLKSLDLDTRLFLGGFTSRGEETAASTPGTRLDAARSVDDLIARLEDEIGALRAVTEAGSGNQAGPRLDAAKMLAHVVKLSHSVPKLGRGRRLDDNLVSLIEHLAVIWVEGCGRPFRWTKKNPQFGFVADLCRAIRPRLSNGRIDAAIRTVAQGLGKKLGSGRAPGKE